MGMFVCGLRFGLGLVCLWVTVHLFNLGLLVLDFCLIYDGLLSLFYCDLLDA